MENLSVTGFREPEIQDICFPGNRRFPGMSVRLSAKTEGRAQPPEIGASPESVIIRKIMNTDSDARYWEKRQW
ncbi:Uncharacterized protein dnm_049370 [Desulfonema magnum]|uniref:Uncharacterized protein n=1 Tax=Desulfonema magnum TaxID=45655 RepID=A0A975GPK5_9BACT|nr:Uncharacterized protein dnm_049370 [Desulfonema magnum]